jgi:hypothetical protein
MKYKKGFMYGYNNTINTILHTSLSRNKFIRLIFLMLSLQNCFSNSNTNPTLLPYLTFTYVQLLIHEVREWRM